MRLSTIKLSGFKSFVDPTVLHLPTNMTGVVGPNGCGKSNIIDAIRWVMGESAASRLRGDALTDVIFSGSSGRKPVGSAMVELLFDNSDGLIGGEYASYNEISVKRVVSRDGQSQYFLNGVRCRRRDITDLFLGTGLGPRSYSIIEQGMISEIVEADPEQLRHHLEEAAGISKYKERRKETESRIKATRENLDRVRDVRDEVDKQLEHLKRQARTAERWQQLKAEQKEKEAQAKALQLRSARADLDGHSAAVRQAELRIEERLAEQRHTELALEQGREKHVTVADHLNAVQAEVYQVGAEIARIEQQIQHARQLAEQLERARVETDRAHEELNQHIAADGQRLEEASAHLAEAEPRLETLRDADAAAVETLRAAEVRLADWQQAWDAHAQSTSSAGQAAEVERTRLDYLDKQALAADQRRSTLEAERAATRLDELGEALARLEEEHALLRERVEEHTAGLDERRGLAESALDAERALQTALSAKRSELENLRGRLGSLEALQHAALGENGAAKAWLDAVGLGQARRLGGALQVAAGWERAVETVLDGWLDAVLVDDPAAHAHDLGSLDAADVALMAEGRHCDAPSGSLAEQVEGPAPARALLARVRTCASLNAARELAASLDPGESLVTPAGEWFGHGFVRVQRGAGAQVGVLAREREIREANQRLSTLEQEIALQGERLAAGKQERIDAEFAREEAQRELYTAHRRLAEVAGQLQSQRGRMDSANERLRRIGTELEEVIGKLDADGEQAREARKRLQSAVDNMGELERRRHELDGERRSLLEGREEARMNAREAHDSAHQLALSIESRRSVVAGLQQSLERMRAQFSQLDARRSEIAAQLQTSSDPLAGLEDQRQGLLEQRLAVDKRMVDARQGLQEHDAQLRKLEQDRHQFEQGLTEQREHLAQARLHEQEHRLRAQALTSAIAEAGFELEAILAALPEQADAQRWQTDLAELEAKIQRLEPVNLAAISEYEEQALRKTYLDSQLTDLGTALETLEGAIRKIDKETRARFKETFDRVNTGVQELFPRLFGGGHAYLELTGEDLLSTGVSIMARPPGKRVTSISLLSGGEKAMTAVALVFSIFRLNPAPFCLLDEVDAPLDEANVGRFSAMVAEMSAHVQFIFVTHNKGTMEAARQLCGVTMREPGVSRLVQVDLEEAAKLAGAA
ncbi:MAG: chromosome segregation protein SMC [Dokdonella sp.]|uniref:chromosome segregation protein SMC n=1 Tax=Dokdonella sp. TaxID=2291710 RepID=UPI0025C34909|nr:chromosome segregation protein SMC [Dokdonella sp.]MBZ0223338.1 chromosome segregation protein SMC [Dokdonella sp.]